MCVGMDSQSAVHRGSGTSHDGHHSRAVFCPVGGGVGGGSPPWSGKFVVLLTLASLFADPRAAVAVGGLLLYGICWCVISGLACVLSALECGCFRVRHWDP